MLTNQFFFRIPKKQVKFYIIVHLFKLIYIFFSFKQAFLANEDVGDSLDSVEALLKKHEDFEKSLVAQEEKIKALDEFASKLIEGQHYAADDVAQRREMLLERRAALLDKSQQRRALLEDAYKYQQFERDCDETKGLCL